MDAGVRGKQSTDRGSATHFKRWMNKFKQGVEGLNDGFIFIAGAMSALLLVWALWRIGSYDATLDLSMRSKPLGGKNPEPRNCHVSSNTADMAITENYGGLTDWDKGPENFYNDPEVSYSIGKPIRDWDSRRRKWLQKHPYVKKYSRSGKPRVLMVSGSQSNPCKNPIGDHLLLRFFKNKVDYCRLHDIDIFYNTVLLEEHMYTFWAKIPMVRAAMVAHPEAEWIWWMDSDTAITDMDFELPLEKYENYNFVVDGWKHLVYEKRSWVSLNAGIFLIRNCEWSLNFMERWASMGPQSPHFEASGELLSDVLSDRAFKDSDDQSALVYLLLKEKEKWADKILVQHSYYLNGYWIDIVGTYENITEKYEAMEREHPLLNQRHAEKISIEYSEMRKPFLGIDESESEAAIYKNKQKTRAFVTHFAGCQPCSGNHNKTFEGENCWKGMERALNFADNQVLKNYGFRHDNLSSSHVTPISSFYFPS